MLLWKKSSTRLQLFYFFQIVLLRILGEELWTFVALALLPLGTLALERALALKVSYLSEASIYPPEQAKTEETSALEWNLETTSR